MLTLRITGNTFEELKKAVAKLDQEMNETVKVQTTFKPFETQEDPSPAVRRDNDRVVQENIARPIARPAHVEATVMTGGELDKRGIPWDERVHSSSKELTKDGSWRARRNVDKNLLRQIEAQSQRPNTQVAFAPPAQVAPSFPQGNFNPPGQHPTPSPVMAQPFPTSVPQPTQAPAPVNYPPMPSSFHGQPVMPQQVVAPQPAAPSYAPPVQAAPVAQPTYDNFAPATRQAHDAKSWVETFNESIGKLVADGKLNVEYLQNLKAHFKVQELWDLNVEQKVEIFHQLSGYGLVHNVAGHA